MDDRGAADRKAVVVMRQWHGPAARGDVAATSPRTCFRSAQPATSRFRQRLGTAAFSVHSRQLLHTHHTGPITITARRHPSGDGGPRGARRRAEERDRARLHHAGGAGAGEAAAGGGTMFSLERPSGSHTRSVLVELTGSTTSSATSMRWRANAGGGPGLRARYIVGKPSVTGILVSPDVAGGWGHLGCDCAAGAQP